jgi:hypothetical protein
MESPDQQYRTRKLTLRCLILLCVEVSVEFIFAVITKPGTTAPLNIPLRGMMPLPDDLRVGETGK